VTALFRNKPFRLFCSAYIIFTTGGSVAAATLVFFMSDYLKSPHLVGPGILLLSITTICAVPGWLWVSRRLGKHIATAVSLLISMGLYAGVTPFLSPGDGWFYVALLAVMGASSAGFTTLPMGLIGDIIDLDTLRHGQPRGGIYWGVWSFAQKVSPALGIGVTLTLLKALGFAPGVHNSDSALAALKYVYCFGPAPFYIVGGIMLLWFPIDARRHDIIRRRLLMRERRESRHRSNPLG
jgi:Na+/melibiose symporter-like transporter